MVTNKKKSKGVKDRKGSAAEQMVAGLEQLLRGPEVAAKTNLWWRDTAAEELREIDIGVEPKEPTGPRAAIECRDRAGRQGVGWIDAMIGKYAFIENVAELIAVARDGFARGAIKKARNLNIGLRILEKVKPEEKLRWIDSGFAIRNHNYEIDITYVQSADGDSVRKLGDLDERGKVTVPKEWLKDADGRVIEPTRIFRCLPESFHEQLGAELDEHGYFEGKKRVNLTPGVFVDNGSVRVAVKCATIKIIGNLFVEITKPLEIRRYRTADQDLAEVIRFVGTFGRTSRSLCLMKTSQPDSDGNCMLGIRIFDALA